MDVRRAAFKLLGPFLHYFPMKDKLQSQVYKQALNIYHSWFDVDFLNVSITYRNFVDARGVNLYFPMHLQRAALRSQHKLSAASDIPLPYETAK